MERGSTALSPRWKPKQRDVRAVGVSKCATWPSAWTPASVRPAPRIVVGGAAVHVGERVLERGLHARAVRLALPADEVGAVVLDGELKRIARAALTALRIRRRGRR